MTKLKSVAILPACPSDIPSLISVFLAGYASNLFFSLAYPGHKTPLIKQFEEQLRKGFSTPGVSLYKAVQSQRPGTESEEDEEVVGWALWVRRPTGEGPGGGVMSLKSGGRASREAAGALAEDKNLGRLKEQRLTEEREKWVKGHDMLVLELLVVRPDRQRLGIGSLLLRVGTEQADTEGLTAWLEATPAGHGLYLKYGFNEVGSTAFDLTKWAGKAFGYGEYKVWFMLRLPKKVDDQALF